MAFDADGHVRRSPRLERQARLCGRSVGRRDGGVGGRPGRELRSCVCLRGIWGELVPHARCHVHRAPTTDGGGEFGSAVALSADGQVALVGAPGAGTSYDGAGYLYSESGATWPSSPTAFFPGPPGAGAEDGNSVALSANGQVALLGAPEGGPFQDGVAFIYAESGGTWSSAPAASFLGPTASDAWLGQSVALSANGQVALLGAPIGGDGAAYLFTESGGTWSTVAAATFTGPAGSPDDLGDEVALSGNGQTAVLGDAPFTGADAIDGAAYLFSAPAGSEQALQTIVFTSAEPSPARSGATYNLVATATSGLPVEFSVDAASTPGACSLSGTTLQLTGGGTCLVDADQARRLGVGGRAPGSDGHHHPRASSPDRCRVVGGHRRPGPNCSQAVLQERPMFGRSRARERRSRPCKGVVLAR